VSCLVCIPAPSRNAYEVLLLRSLKLREKGGGENPWVWGGEREATDMVCSAQ